MGYTVLFFGIVLASLAAFHIAAFYSSNFPLVSLYTPNATLFGSAAVVSFAHLRMSMPWIPSFRRNDGKYSKEGTWDHEYTSQSLGTAAMPMVKYQLTFTGAYLVSCWPRCQRCFSSKAGKSSARVQLAMIVVLAGSCNCTSYRVPPSRILYILIEILQLLFEKAL